MVVFPLAYALLTWNLIQKGWFFHGLNLSGSMGFGFTGYMHGYFQSVILECIWGLIALSGLIMLMPMIMTSRLPDTLDDVETVDIDLLSNAD